MNEQSTIITPTDLCRLASQMRAHVAATETVASRVVTLADQSYQLMLRPGPDHQIQLSATGSGHQWPDDWQVELCQAFGVPEGTLMQFDLVNDHQVVKWTWTLPAPEEQSLQLSFALLDVDASGRYYERG